MNNKHGDKNLLKRGYRPSEHPDIFVKSPDNWLEKVGAYIGEDRKMRLPIRPVLLPMAIAAEAKEKYDKAKHLNQKIHAAFVIVAAVRSAENAYFNTLAPIINEQEKEKGIEICGACLRNSKIFNTNLKALRRKANDQIIHKMDRGLLINEEDAKIGVEYYEEMFKLPMMNPIQWNGAEVTVCRSCRSKHFKNKKS